MRTRKIFFTFIPILLTLIFSYILWVGGAQLAAADSVGNEQGYSDISEDLAKDDKFDIADYPAIGGDHRMEIIQVAESDKGELYLYVYQPCPYEKMLGTSVNISTAINESLSYKNYKLTLLSSKETLYKYRVDGLEVKADAMRYYDISSILHAYNEDIDDKPQYGNTVQEVADEVGQLWTAVTLDGKTSYNKTQTETVVITDKYVGVIRYLDGTLPLFASDYCDSHFVAFSTDHQIDDLIEADVYYKAQYFDYTSVRYPFTQDFQITENNSDAQPHEEYVTLTYSDTAENDTNWFFGKKHIWNRIEKVEEFISKEELTDEAKQELDGKQWVLRFKETDYVGSYSKENLTQIETMKAKYTEISSVTILRLKFETNGEVYNLGVVDTKQTGDGMPDNDVETGMESTFDNVFGTGKGQNCANAMLWGLKWWLWPILIIAAIIVLIVLVKLFPLIMEMLSLLLQGLVWLISAPFKAIKSAIEKHKSKKQKKKTAKPKKVKKPKKTNKK